MMVRLICAAFALAAILCSGAAIAQEVAGRVLIAVGEVTIERGAERIRAWRGAEVRAGDLFVLGENSNAQLRLSDESIIALRPQTTFRLTQYAFQNRPPKEQRSFFDLLKGGLRTVTGLIGRSNRDNYAVRTTTATIGIRGTHYALVECLKSCFNADGTLAQDGTYGAVSDGRIGATTDKGEKVFGADQYFHVASKSSEAQPLIAPPPFVRDALQARGATVPVAQKPVPGEARAAPSASAPGGETATVIAMSGSGGDLAGDINPRGYVPPSLPPNVDASAFVGGTPSGGGVDLPTTVADAATAAGTLGQIVSIPGEGILLYRLTSGVLSGNCASGPPCELQVAEIRFAINLQTQSVQGRINVVDTEDGGAFNLSTGLQQSLPVTNNNGVLSFAGTLTPSNGAVLRCQSCGVQGTPDQLQSLNVNGTISGGTLNLTFTGVPPDGQAGTFSAVLALVALPTTPVAAVAYPSFGAGNPNQVTQSSGLDNVVDASGLVRYGWLAGGPQGSRGSATPVVVGSDASAGNLVWGKWTGPGAQIVDNAYNSFVTSGGRVDWIYGDPAFVTNLSGLGTVTYAPVGWSLNNGTGTLNSASLTANFTTRQIDFNTNVTNTNVGNTFQLAGSTRYGVATTRFQGTLSGTCSGSCSSVAPVPASGGFAGFLSGSSAEGAGVAISAGTGVQGQGVSGVIGFKR